jgi:hypothetical protein
MGYKLSHVSKILDQAAASHPPLAELLQATEFYDNAITNYIERKQDPGLTDRERGLLNYRLAECCLALLDADPNQPEVRELLDGSLQSALLYLENELEQAWALRLLEKIESTNP